MNGLIGFPTMPDNKNLSTLKFQYDEPVEGTYWDEEKQEYYTIERAGYISETGIEFKTKKEPDGLNRAQRRKLKKNK